MTEASISLSVDEFKLLIKNILNVNFKKKKAVLEVYNIFLKIRKTPNYMGMVLSSIELFNSSVWEDELETIENFDLSNRIKNIGLMLIDVQDQDAREMFKFLTVELTNLATKASLEEFLLKELDLNQTIAENIYFHNIEDEDMAKQLLLAKMQSVCMSEVDENSLNIRTNGKKFSNEKIAEKIAEYYENLGYSTEADEQQVLALKDGKTHFRTYTTNDSWMPGSFSRILITINQYS